MYPPISAGYLDIEAISGILGSISICSWVVVFSPQIIENFRRSSAEGLSIEFLIIWLAGDVFNILGAILQGVLPTMIILAIYYTFADIVLLGQCFYYRGFTLRDPRPDKAVSDQEQANGAPPPSERTALLSPNGHTTSPHPPLLSERTRSASSFRERLASIDGTRLSPATPLHHQQDHTSVSSPNPTPEPRTILQTLLFNTTAITLVILAGIAGYYLSPSPSPPSSSDPPSSSSSPEFSLWGQLFGYACALLYLGSRIPQLLLNARRQSTEGLNALFFIFACIGNLTYVLSILAYSPTCNHRHGCKDGEALELYGRYVLVNLSWLLGSLGTLFLDFAVFVQFFLYRGREPKGQVVANGNGNNGLASEERGRETAG